MFFSVITKNFNIFWVHRKIRLLGGILKNQYIGGDWTVCWFNRGGRSLAGKRARDDLPKLNSCILMETVTIPVGQVDEFYFYMHYPIKAWLFEKIIFELVYLFHIALKSLVSY